MQILADTLGADLHTPVEVEAGALGAAILAAVGAGLYPDRQTAATEMVSAGRVYRPEPQLRPLYQDIYQRWRATEERWRAVRP
jgi:sugar (pentulose or hexulose) kinase